MTMTETEKPAPDGLEIVAWHWEGRASDHTFPVWAWQKERPATAPENAIALADFDQAQSLIAGLRADNQDLLAAADADAFVNGNLQAEVKRLTEANNGLMAERESLIETKREQIERLELSRGAASKVALDAIAEKETTEARIKALEEALTPSGDTKAAYIGEFAFPLVYTDDNGDSATTSVTVPWTAVKDIMAAITARATLNSREKVDG